MFSVVKHANFYYVPWIAENVDHVTFHVHFRPPVVFGQTITTQNHSVWFSGIPLRRLTLAPIARRYDVVHPCYAAVRFRATHVGNVRENGRVLGESSI